MEGSTSMPVSFAVFSRIVSTGNVTKIESHFVSDWTELCPNFG